MNSRKFIFGFVTLILVTVTTFQMVYALDDVPEEAQEERIEEVLEETSKEDKLHFICYLFAEPFVFGFKPQHGYAAWVQAELGETRQYARVPTYLAHCCLKVYC